MTNLAQSRSMDAHIVTEVLGGRIWCDDRGVFFQDLYYPLADGYATTSGPLRHYSTRHEDAQHLKEEIYRRSGVLLSEAVRDNYTNYDAWERAHCMHICQQALALGDKVYYHPSEALIAYTERVNSFYVNGLDLDRFEAPCVYIVKSGPYHKIGHTHGPLRDRISALDTGSPYPLHVVHVIPNMDPRRIEAALHLEFSGKRVKGEWFDLSDDDLRSIVLRVWGAA